MYEQSYNCMKYVKNENKTNMHGTLESIQRYMRYVRKVPGLTSQKKYFKSKLQSNSLIALFLLSPSK